MAGDVPVEPLAGTYRAARGPVQTSNSERPVTSGGRCSQTSV